MGAHNVPLECAPSPPREPGFEVRVFSFFLAFVQPVPSSQVLDAYGTGLALSGN